VCGKGTDSAMFGVVGQKYYGLNTFVTKDWDKAKILLKKNKPLIAYTHPSENGHFSKSSGHYVVFGVMSNLGCYLANISSIIFCFVCLFSPLCSLVNSFKWEQYPSSELVVLGI